jgi:hypothetical protein
MSDILGVGLTHNPPLLGTDADMSWTLDDPDIRAAAKDLSNWPGAKVFAVYPVVTG